MSVSHWSRLAITSDKRTHGRECGQLSRSGTPAARAASGMAWSCALLTCLNFERDGLVLLTLGRTLVDGARLGRPARLGVLAPPPGEQDAGSSHCGRRVACGQRVPVWLYEFIRGHCGGSDVLGMVDDDHLSCFINLIVAVADNHSAVNERSTNPPFVIWVRGHRGSYGTGVRGSCRH